MHWIGYKKNMRAYCKRLNISGYDAPHGTSRCVLWEKRENARLPNAEITDGYRRPTAPNPPKSERR